MSLRDKVTNFWPIFLSTHLNSRNRQLHLLGNVWMVACIFGFSLSRWLPFLALSFAGYIPSWVGHFVFEQNKPATFQAPFISALCDLKMVGYILSGQVDFEIQRLFGETQPAPGTKIKVTIEQERIYQEQMRLNAGRGIGKHPFRQYWEVFVLKHQNPLNIWVHFFAMVYLYALLVICVLTQRWELLVLIPLSQMAGLVSHSLVERTYIDFDDAIFSKRAFICLNRLVFMVITGRYWAELSRVQNELRTWKLANE